MASRQVPCAWEIGRDGLIRLDGVVVCSKVRGFEVAVKDRDGMRSARRGSEFPTGDLMDLVRMLADEMVRGAGGTGQ